MTALDSFRSGTNYYLLLKNARRDKIFRNRSQVQACPPDGRRGSRFKVDELVKSRKTPSPSMGEGWGEGKWDFLRDHQG
jgi:hypothetical protein